MSFIKKNQKIKKTTHISCLSNESKTNTAFYEFFKVNEKFAEYINQFTIIIWKVTGERENETQLKFEWRWRLLNEFNDFFIFFLGWKLN